MSDLVERLRGTREWVGFPATPICAEAADEIRRLRAASADLATENERLRAALLSCACPGGGWNGMPAGTEATVAACVENKVCGCSLGAALESPTH